MSRIFGESSKNKVSIIAANFFGIPEALASWVRQINYTKLANKICGVSGRDNASMEQLSNLTVAENIILHCIDCGIQENKYYKDIYQDCKKRLEMFKDIAYLEVA